MYRLYKLYMSYDKYIKCCSCHRWWIPGQCRAHSPPAAGSQRAGGGVERRDPVPPACMPPSTGTSPGRDQHSNAQANIMFNPESWSNHSHGKSNLIVNAKSCIIHSHGQAKFMDKSMSLWNHEHCKNHGYITRHGSDHEIKPLQLISATPRELAFDSKPSNKKLYLWQNKDTTTPAFNPVCVDASILVNIMLIVVDPLVLVS